MRHLQYVHFTPFNFYFAHTAQKNQRSVTIRQMAPEVLSATLNVKNFDSFRKADVYSFGLVIWECVRRLQFGGVADQYQLPYFEFVGNNPSLDEMKHAVVEEGSRPCFSDGQRDALADICELAEECWLVRPDDRPTMLRVKKTLASIITN